MDSFESFLSGIVGEAIPLLAWVGLAYLFRLKEAKSRRDRIVMYASVTAYLLYLGAFLYYLGTQTGSCTCGVALIFVLGQGVGIVIAGVRMFVQGHKQTVSQISVQEVAAVGQRSKGTNWLIVIVASTLVGGLVIGFWWFLPMP